MKRNIKEICSNLGLNKKDYDIINIAVCQMWNKGKVTTEDFRRQIGSRIPNIFTSLCEVIGHNSDKTQKMMSNGDINSKILPEVFKNYLNGFSKFKKEKSILSDYELKRSYKI